MSSEQITEVRNKVFISYSQKDDKWLKRLQTHLKPYEREYGLEVWDDTRIDAGREWEEEIQKALASTKVAVLLVTANFLASDFIMREEVPKFLDAAKKGGATILWIPISFASYEASKIIKFQALGKLSQPLDSLKRSDRDKALADIAKKIMENMTTEKG